MARQLNLWNPYLHTFHKLGEKEWRKRNPNYFWSKPLTPNNIDKSNYQLCIKLVNFSDPSSFWEMKSRQIIEYEPENLIKIAMEENLYTFLKHK